jgi:hypothetical protein
MELASNARSPYYFHPAAKAGHPDIFDCYSAAAVDAEKQKKY